MHSMWVPDPVPSEPNAGVTTPGWMAVVLFGAEAAFIDTNWALIRKLLYIRLDTVRPFKRLRASGRIEVSMAS